MRSPTKAQIEKWCAALRSGKYKQTRGRLQDEDGHCCLGVACEVFIPRTKRVMVDDCDMFGGSTDEPYLYGAEPTEQNAAPEWLRDVNEHFADQFVDWHASEEAALFYLNDGYNGNPRYTFDEIADLLEAVYIHEVLK